MTATLIMLSEVRGPFSAVAAAAACRLYPRSAHAGMVDSLRYPSLQTGLFQNCNLAGVIKLVLGHTVQHEIQVVALAGNALGQACVR